MRPSIISALVALASLASAQAAIAQCDPDYDCQWTHVDRNTGYLWEFDFSHLCDDFGYRIDDPNNHTYYFNICGTPPQHCLPKGYKSRYVTGEALQEWGSVPDCNPNDNSTMCWNPIENRYMCCTKDCEVLGVGTPLWSLIDEDSPGMGVMLRHQGVPSTADDPYRCPPDPKTGAPSKARSVTIFLYCDPILPHGVLEEDQAYENNTCEYVIEARTADSCGCEPDCIGKNCGDDGCGGFCSGAALGGNCPFEYECIDQVCCRRDCNHRDCGDDGCGGSCGTCGEDEVCTPFQMCQSSTPYIPPTAAVYKVDSGGLAGAFFGGILVAGVVAGVIYFFLHGGKARFDRWRMAGAPIVGSSGTGTADRTSLMGNSVTAQATPAASTAATATRGYGT